MPLPQWIGFVDCAANPSVLTGADGQTSSRQLVEHNLLGTINLLEYCKRTKAGLILLSTSRVYSIEPLARVPVEVHGGAFHLAVGRPLPVGVSRAGIDENFSTTAPIALYGVTKLTSEALALEYAATFGFEVWVNRCGVTAGAGQFGRPDQGIFAYWINSHLRKKPLRYIGLGGRDHQVRDCLHPRDLVALIQRQIAASGDRSKPRLVNVSGGAASACSLAQLTDWCDARFGKCAIAGDPTPRAFDLPWVVLSSNRAEDMWRWKAMTPILNDIAIHAQSNPRWLDISSTN